MKKIILFLMTFLAFNSASAFESQMINTNFYSKSLGVRMPIAIYLPYKAKHRQRSRYKVIYMLHGMSDHYNTWQTAAHIKKLIDKMIRRHRINKVIVVFPEGENSYYYNSVEGRFEDYIVKDVRQYAEKNFPIRKGRKNRAILGISMGGAGAMRLALKYPEMFKYVFGLSGIYNPDYMSYELRILNRERLSGLKIFFWAGKSDPAKNYALFLNKVLQRHGIKHSFALRKGRHDWPQWIPEIKISLIKFVGRAKVGKKIRITGKNVKF